MACNHCPPIRVVLFVVARALGHDDGVRAEQAGFALKNAEKVTHGQITVAKLAMPNRCEHVEPLVQLVLNRRGIENLGKEDEILALLASDIDDVLPQSVGQTLGEIVPQVPSFCRL